MTLNRVTASESPHVDKPVADLVAVYGRRAVYANSVYGVGQTTASKILAKIQDTDKEVLTTCSGRS